MFTVPLIPIYSRVSAANRLAWLLERVCHCCSFSGKFGHGSSNMLDKALQTNMWACVHKNTQRSYYFNPEYIQDILRISQIGGNKSQKGPKLNKSMKWSQHFICITKAYLLGKSARLSFCSNEVEDVLNSWQSDQKHRPHCGGYGNHQMARWQQQLFRYLEIKANHLVSTCCSAFHRLSQMLNIFLLRFSKTFACIIKHQTVGGNEH